MAELEKRGGEQATAASADEERLLGEEVALLDFDMLCSTVVIQAQKGKWGELNGDNEDDDSVSNYHQYGGGLHRMWEGELLHDCFDGRRLALQSSCCPWYRFGKNMKRAGFGSCFLQGSIHLILVIIVLSNLVAFAITRRCYFLYLALSFALSVGTYMGYYRIQIKNKFNIKGGGTSLDDCVYHLICPCCTLCQESRTLEMNNVQDGIWHGRGDTICVVSFSEDSKAYSELSPPFVVATKCPERLSMPETSKDIIVLPTSVVGHAPHFIPPPVSV
ncbi:PLAC8 family protein [Perilla frutescens var. frutescens]|nr:PLAC8 family protein [Perilla frutescens var. frutescens]